MRSFGITSLLLAAVLVASVGTAAGQAGGQISGRAVDADDRPVKGVKIRFTQQGGSFEQVVTTRKNGRFAHRGFPPGQYVVDLADETRFVTRFSYELKNADGLTVGEGSMDGHPRRGAGPFPFSGRSAMSVKLVVADRDSGEAYEQKLAFAAPELNAMVKQYEKGNYDKVIDLATSILEGDPEIGEAHYMQGIALKRLERFDEARLALEKAATRIPDYPGIWRVLGETNLDLARDLAASGQAEPAGQAWTRAADALEAALERDPESPGILVGLAASLEKTGEHDRLIPVLERILELEPSNLQARLRMASLVSQAGDQQKAMALLEAVPDTEKRAAVTIYNVAVELQESGDLDSALAAARRAAEIDPRLPQPQVLLVQIHLAQGDKAAAAEAIERFLALAPDDPKAETYRQILGQLETQ